MAQEMRLSNFTDDKGTLGNETLIGGPGAPDTVVRATAAMTPEQAAETRQNIGADTPETVTEWLDAHVDPDTGYVIDDTLTIQGAAADAKATGDRLNVVEAKTESELGSTTETTPTITFDDGYAIRTSGSIGEVYTSSDSSVSNNISLENATSVKCYYQGTNPYGDYFFYKTDDSYISNAAIGGTEAEISIPDNAAYMRFYCMTSRKSNVTVKVKTETEGAVYTALDGKLNKNQGAENENKLLVVGSDGNISLQNIRDSRPTYMGNYPVKPLLAEFMAGFAWCSMALPSAFTGKNVVVTVSGSAGSDELSASAISPNTLNVSDIGTDWVGGVISADGESFKVCNFKYVSGTTIKVFPALEESVSNATLSTLIYDGGYISGNPYVGLHLTENGFKAYIQHLYNQNPKHCEIGRYIDTFRPDLDSTTTSPFTWYGSNQITPEQYRFITLNPYTYWLNAPAVRQYSLTFYSNYTPHTTKSGAYWDVDLKNQSGYLEAYIYARTDNVLSLPDGQEIHVEVTIDGEKVLDQTISDTVCRRIVVDYENAKTGRIEIYSNKWQSVDGSIYGFGIGRVTWWINDLQYSDQKLFPKGAVVAEMFDSWGVFHDGITGTWFEHLHNSATGVSVPFTNESKGDQTSAWGKAWFYEKVWKNNPSMCIHDFVINDANSIGSSVPDTIEGPDGEEYNNKLTASDYAQNMILLGLLAVKNGIQPIFMRNCQHGQTSYTTFTNALIDAMSEKIE